MYKVWNYNTLDFFLISKNHFIFSASKQGDPLSEEQSHSKTDNFLYKMSLLLKQ